ncbi:hypothetical protein [Paraburkholderia adhaesiva]|uniref:hypothetical protein n=1 Tax=Paraburkholderia adhaesiva TaxID=2883244 RepID=UPI001F40FAE9|nr:hypothetical protein [Paraburkholderia adhaesiva]
MAATITGGAKLEAVLRAATAKLAAAGTLEVGFMSRATEADNTPVVEVATVNEFGGTVNVPAHETTVYRKLGREGELLRGGRFVKAQQSNFATTHEVPAYTVTIPPRPFFRSMVAKESPHWGGDLGKALVAVNYDADRALDLMGEEINGALIESIRNFTDPPNAPSTIAKKGGDDPLVDSGTMLKGTTWRIDPGGTGT